MRQSVNIQAWGSHQLVLLDIIKRTEKPILELGAGDYSTRQIHDECKNQITTIEEAEEWYFRYKYLADKRHEFLILSEDILINDFIANDTIQWGVVFVDCGTWVGRVAAIKKYKNIADYVIIHDTEYSASMGYFGKMLGDKRDFSEDFKYWIEFMPYQMIQLPATVVGSNVISLKNIKIQSMLKIGENV